MPKLNALVAGSTGYIGVQLIKLLIKHKYINIRFLCGNSSVGKNISSYDKSLSGKKLPKIIKFNKKLLKDVDVVFTALPNGEAQDISKHLTKNITLIDLAADFRLEKGSEYLKWYSVFKYLSIIKPAIGAAQVEPHPPFSIYTAMAISGFSFGANAIKIE